MVSIQKIAYFALCFEDNQLKINKINYSHVKSLSNYRHNVSHSKRRTKRKFEVNLFNRKFFWVEQQIWIRLTVSAAGLRTINKIGLNAAIKQAAEKGYLTSIKTVE